MDPAMDHPTSNVAESAPPVPHRHAVAPSVATANAIGAFVSSHANNSTNWSVTPAQDPTSSFSFSKPTSKPSTLHNSRDTAQLASPSHLLAAQSLLGDGVSARVGESGPRGEGGGGGNVKTGQIRASSDENDAGTTTVQMPQSSAHVTPQNQYHQASNRRGGLPTPDSAGLEQYRLGPLSSNVDRARTNLHPPAGTPSAMYSVVGKSHSGSPPARRSTQPSSTSLLKTAPVTGVLSSNPSRSSVLSNQTQPSSPLITINRHAAQKSNVRNETSLQANRSNANAAAPPRSNMSNSASNPPDYSRQTSQPLLPGSGGRATPIPIQPTPLTPNNPARSRTDASTTPDPLGLAASLFASLNQGITEKDKEISLLKFQLAATISDLKQARNDKELIKSDTLQRINLALQRSEISRSNLENTAIEMRGATHAASGTTSADVTIGAIREDLDSVKGSLHDFFETHGHLMSQNMDSPLNTIKSIIQNELAARQNVIILLRSELEAKAGDLSEARERINLLEQNSLQNVSWIADISEKMATAGPQLTAAVEAQARLHRSIRDAEDRYLLLMTDLEREKALGKTRLRELEEERATVLRITSELDEVNSIKKSLLESIDSLQAEIENHVIESGNHIMLIEEEKGILLSDIEAERMALKVAEGGIASVGLENASLKAEAQVLQVAVDRSKIDADKLRSAITDKDADIKEFTREVQELRSKEALLLDRNRKCEEDIVAARHRLDQAAAEDKALRIQLEAEVAQLRIDLASSHATTHDSDQATSVAAAAEKMAVLSAHNTKLAREVSTLTSLQAASLSNAQELHLQLASVQSDRDSLFEVKVNYESEIQLLRQSTSKYGDSVAILQAQIKKMEESNELWRRQTKQQAYKECIAGSERIKSDLNNDLKRANNKIIETEKKLNRAQVELAKAKNRPMIDPHIVSSSPVECISDIIRQPSSDIESASDDRDPSINFAAGSAHPHSRTAKRQSTAHTLTSIGLGSDDTDDIVDATMLLSPPKLKAVAERKIPTRGNKRRNPAQQATEDDDVEDVAEDDEFLAPVAPEKGRLSKTYHMKRKKK